MLSTLLFLLSVIVIGLLLTAIMALVSVLGGVQLVTTPKSIWPLIRELAEFQPGEQFVELGSGLGYVAGHVAQSTGAHALGVDLAPLWVWLARFIHRRSGATFRIGNLYTVDLSGATVVYCYLLPPMLAKLAPKFATELAPGSRVITYGFPLPHRRPNRVIERTTTHGPLYLYEY